MSTINPFSINALLHVATRITNQHNVWLTQLQERQNQTQEPQQHQNLDFQNRDFSFEGQTHDPGRRNQNQDFGSQDFGSQDIQNRNQDFGSRDFGFGDQYQDLSQMPSKNRFRKRTRDQNQNKDFDFDFVDQNQDIQNQNLDGQDQDQNQNQDVQNRDFGFGDQTHGFEDHEWNPQPKRTRGRPRKKSQDQNRNQDFGGQYIRNRNQDFGGRDFGFDFGAHEWNPQPKRTRGRPRKKSQDQDQNRNQDFGGQDIQNRDFGFGGQQEVSQQPWKRSKGRPKKANEDYSIKDFQKILCGDPVVEATRTLPTEPLPPYMVIMMQMQMQMQAQTQMQNGPRHENQLNQYAEPTPIDYSNKLIGLDLLGRISPEKMSLIMFEMQRRDQLFKYKLAFVQRIINLDDKLTKIDNTLNEHVENTKRRNSEEYLVALRMNEKAQLRTRPERGYAVARQKVHNLYKKEIFKTKAVISRLNSENEIIELRFDNFINNMT